MPRRRSPTDLTEAQWALLAPLVPAPKSGGRPATHDRWELVDAMLYVLRGGIAWHALPHDLPPWQTVSHDCRLWRADGTWEQINGVVRERVRSQAGRHPTPSGAILARQRVKATEQGGHVATTEPKK